MKNTRKKLSGEKIAGAFGILSFFISIVTSFVSKSTIVYLIVVIACVIGIIMCTISFDHGLLIGILLTIITFVLIVLGREEIPEIINFEDHEKYNKAMEYVQENNYEMAIKTFQQLDEEYFERENIKEEYNSVVNSYRENVFSNIEILIEDKDYTSALSVLSYANSIVNNDAEIQDKIEEVRRLDVINTIEIYIADQEYEKAVQYGENQCESGIQDASVDQLIQKARDMYKTEVIHTAEQYMQTGQYDLAEKVLKEALELLGEDEDISRLLSEIEAKKPKDLTSLETRSLSSCLDLDVRYDYQDDYGNIYSGPALSGDKATLMDPFTFGNSYFINSQYKTLKATVTILEGCSTGSVKFYNDEERFAEYEIDIAKDQPYEISVNVENINLLGITIEGAVLANATLYAESN